MGTENAPFGLRAVYHPSGTIRAYSLANGIDSGYTSWIYQNMPVKLSAGFLIAGTAGAAFVGSFQGVQWADPATGRTNYSNRWAASTTYVAGSCIATFYRDPGIVYEVQLDNSVVQDTIGDQIHFTSSIGTGNSVTGMSSAVGSSSLVPSTGQLEIMDIAPYAGNAWGDQYPIVRVTISMHQDVADHLKY